jgi:hypothetical protein
LGEKAIISSVGAPSAQAFGQTFGHHLKPYLLTLIRQGGPTRTSADVSVPRLAGFSLIT